MAAGLTSSAPAPSSPTVPTPARPIARGEPAVTTSPPADASDVVESRAATDAAMRRTGRLYGNRAAKWLAGPLHARAAALLCRFAAGRAAVALVVRVGVVAAE